MPIVYVIPSNNADATLRYPFAQKGDEFDPTRVLWQDSYGTTVESAAADFAAVRRDTGKAGYKNKVWLPDGTQTTQDIEALHVIISFSLDELNMNSPEFKGMSPAERACEFAKRLTKRQMPGYQYVLAVQGDTDQLHVHEVVNTVSFEDVTVTLPGLPILDENGEPVLDDEGNPTHHEGKTQVRRAGRLLGGWTTDIEHIRATADEIAKELSITQTLDPYVKDKPVPRTVSRADRNAERRGAKTNRDIFRDLADDLIEGGASSLDDLVKKLAENEWTIEFSTWTSGKNKGKPKVSVKGPGMSQKIHGGNGGVKDLGTDYYKDGLERRIAERQAEIARQREVEEAEAAATTKTKVLSTDELADQVLAQMDADDDLRAASERGMNDLLARMKSTSILPPSDQVVEVTRDLQALEDQARPATPAEPITPDVVDEVEEEVVETEQLPKTMVGPILWGTDGRQLLQGKGDGFGTGRDKLPVCFNNYSEPIDPDFNDPNSWLVLPEHELDDEFLARLDDAVDKAVDHKLFTREAMDRYIEENGQDEPLLDHWEDHVVSTSDGGLGSSPEVTATPEKEDYKPLFDKKATGPQGPTRSY